MHTYYNSDISYCCITIAKERLLSSYTCTFFEYINRSCVTKSILCMDGTQEGYCIAIICIYIAS